MCESCDTILTVIPEVDINLEVGTIAALTYQDGKVQNQKAFLVINVENEHPLFRYRYIHLKLQK